MNNEIPKSPLDEDSEQFLGDAVIDSNDWEPLMIQRLRIKQLYLVDGLTREQTQIVMKDRYQIDASDRRYRYLIEKKWQLQKTLTLEEKKFAILKTLQRQQQEGLQTKFLLCGRDIDDSKLSRKRKAIIATETSHRDLGPTPRNLIYYTPPPGAAVLSSPRSQSKPAGKNSQIESKPLCLNCIKCEHDIYGFGTNVLAEFERHLNKEHEIRLPVTSVLASSPHKPKSLLDCPLYDQIFAWSIDEISVEFRELHSLATVRSLSSVSVIQQEQPTHLWLVHDTQTNGLISLGTLTKSSDPTPRSFFTNLHDKLSSQAEKHSTKTVIKPRKLELPTDASNAKPITSNQDKDRGYLKRAAVATNDSDLGSQPMKRLQRQRDRCIGSSQKRDGFGGEIIADQIKNVPEIAPRIMQHLDSVDSRRSSNLGTHSESFAAADGSERADKEKQPTYLKEKLGMTEESKTETKDDMVDTEAYFQPYSIQEDKLPLLGVPMALTASEESRIRSLYSSSGPRNGLTALQEPLNNNATQLRQNQDTFLSIPRSEEEDFEEFRQVNLNYQSKDLSMIKANSSMSTIDLIKEHLDIEVAAYALLSATRKADEDFGIF